MGRRTTSISRRCIAVSLAVGLLSTGMVGATGAAAHPGHDHSASARGIGVHVTAPEPLHGFFPAVQWGDSGEVDDQEGRLVYGGSGCTPASYAEVLGELEGNIALVDAAASETNPVDQCPASTFFQRVQSAQQAGAIGFVQIPAEGEEPSADATAVDADIPALEVERTEEVLAVRDAVISGEEVAAILEDRTESVDLERMSSVTCEDGQAGPFDCDGIDLESFVPAEEFDGAGQSDLWGWTDPDRGDEYVMIGKTNGVAFFRVTDPTDPVYLGELPNRAVLEEIWHDIKVYEDHAIIVSESAPHGMKTFDLTRLRDVEEPQEWNEDGFYPLNVSAHNVEVNTETGYAYIVGGNVGIVVPDHCLSGLHMVDISTPTSPTFAGCYLEEGGPGTAARSVGDPAEELSPAAYVHDTQCVVYDGPDERYTDREICFNSAEDRVVIADVTDKTAPVTLGSTDYPHVAYAHQGWLTEDHAYLIVNDELDETTFDLDTRTVVLDVTDLENPEFHFEHFHDTQAITHNNYVVGGLVYQSNYTSGLRVLDTTAIAERRLEPVAHFDTFPAHGDPTFEGTWSNYPFFASGTIAVSGIDEGLFLLRLQEDDPDPADPDPTERSVEVVCDDCPVEVRSGERGDATLAVANTGAADDRYELAVEGFPDDWTATVDPASIDVAAGEDGEAIVTIEVPRRARPDTYTGTVTATSVHEAGVAGAVEVEVEVIRGRPSDAGPPEDRGPSGRADAPATGASTAMVAARTPGAATLPTTATGVLLVALLAGWIGSRRLAR